MGTAASAASRFYNTSSKVSAHYGVLLDGSIWHWVDEDNTAYHSGDYPMNQRSIGIEHEDNGDYNGIRTDALYSASAKLVRDICLFYQIPIDRMHILKHSEVIATGCPDALDIERIVREANGTVNQQTLIDQLRADRYRNWQLYQQEQAAKIQLEDAVAQKQKSIDTLTKENLDLKKTVDTITSEKATLSASLQKLTNERDGFKNDFEVCDSLMKNRKTLDQYTTRELFDEMLSRFLRR